MAEGKKSRTGLFIILAASGLAILAALVAFLLTTESSMKQRQRAATYEATAAEHLRNIAAAQQNHLDVFGNYATFDQLVDAGILLNEKFRGAEPVVGGYVYRMRVTPREGDRPPSFAVNADPHVADDTPTGGTHFYLDSNVVGVRQNGSRPATAADRPRE